MSERLNIFLSCSRGLEKVLSQEAQALNLPKVRIERGGVSFAGNFEDLITANLKLRCANKVHVRVASFAQSDPSFDCLPWDSYLLRSKSVAVSVVDKRMIQSERFVSVRSVENALRNCGYSIAKDGLQIEVRIEEERTHVSINTSGASLEKRDQRIIQRSKHSARPIVYASMLRAFRYFGKEPLIAPLDHLGSLMLDAAEVALGIPRQSERHFAFAQMANFPSEVLKSASLEISEIGEPPKIIAFHVHGEQSEEAIANIQNAGFHELIEIVNKCPTDIPLPGPAGLLVLPEEFIFTPEAVEKLNDHYRGWRIGRAIRKNTTSAMVKGLNFQKIAEVDSAMKFFLTPPL